MRAYDKTQMAYVGAEGSKAKGSRSKSFSRECCNGTKAKKPKDKPLAELVVFDELINWVPKQVNQTVKLLATELELSSGQVKSLKVLRV